MGIGVASWGLIAAATTSLAVCGLAFLVGNRVGWFDRPDGDLKTHVRAVVPMGGVGILAGTQVGLVVADAFDPALLAATAVVWLLGFVDDVRGLSPAIRLAGATVAAVLLVALSDQPLTWEVAVLWVIATVVIINAINLLDGMDGLVGVVSIAALFGLWLFGAGQETVGPHFYVVSIAAIAGFLYWNLPPARMFLGDNGAYVVGVTLAWAAMRASPDGAASLVAIALVGVPLLDLAITVARRVASRRSLMRGDRDHTYDRLRARGWRISAVLGVFVMIQVMWTGAILALSAIWGDLVAAAGALIGGAVIAGLALIRSARFRSA